MGRAGGVLSVGDGFVSRIFFGPPLRRASSSLIDRKKAGQCHGRNFLFSRRRYGCRVARQGE
jgi:hypothetical protein